MYHYTCVHNNDYSTADLFMNKISMPTHMFLMEPMNAWFCPEEEVYGHMSVFPQSWYMLPLAI